MPEYLYLASQSPRRRELLAQMGVPYRLLLPNTDGDEGEDAEAIEAVRPGEAPTHYVRRVTLAKLDAALARLTRRGWPVAPVLCSDTTVALGRKLLGKPQDDGDAIRMLEMLSGRVHTVLTAVAVQSYARHAVVVSRSRVRFMPLDASLIARYVASGEPFGKAGAYAVQGYAGRFVAHMSGSYSGIMGLPMHETALLLDGVGLHWPQAATPPA